MKNYKNYFIIQEIPEIVYKAFTVENTLRLWTGFEADMKEEVGYEFSLWDGDISGINLAFEPNKLIQQEWFFGEQEEKSIVTFKFHEHKKGTSLELNHTNIPDEDYEDIVEGWNEIFFKDLIDFFEE